MSALAEYYRTNGARGLALDGQNLIDLAFELGMMPDQILASDTTWINKMIIANQARAQAALTPQRRG